MFCTKCGNELPVNAKFCTKCGTKVETPFRPGAKEKLSTAAGSGTAEKLSTAAGSDTAADTDPGKTGKPGITATAKKE